MTTQIIYYDLKWLKPNSLNPRKTFDENSLKELAESLKQVGMLAPIICRIKNKQVPQTLEIVCGERRFRAAKIAGLETIPVITRELTDDEAFDLMITENLQRSDVSPMEEAAAFKSLLEHGKYDINALALRFGKSESFIRMRLKLNDLIAEFIELLEQDVIGIGLAHELCKVSENNQQELYKETFLNRTQWWSLLTVKQLKEKIKRNFMLVLSEATFSTEDTTLDEKIGACTTCPNNTASNMLLFPESPDKGWCLDSTCFKYKSRLFFDRELARIQEDNPDIIIGYSSHIYGDDEKEAKNFQHNGLPAVEMGWQTGWQEVSTPDLPDDKPDEADYSDPEEFLEVMTDYQKEMANYEIELNEYQAKVDSGLLRKSFMIAGADKGKIVFYEQTEGNTSLSTTAAEESTHKLIADLTAKDARNLALSFEKTYLAAVQINALNDYTKGIDEISATEWAAFFTILLSCICNEDLETSIFGETCRYIPNKKLLPAAVRVTDDQKVRLIRNFINKELITSTPIDLESDAKALIAITRERYPEALETVETTQQAIYLKRKQAIDARIAEINEGISDK